MHLRGELKDRTKSKDKRLKIIETRIVERQYGFLCFNELLTEPRTKSQDIRGER